MVVFRGIGKVVNTVVGGAAKGGVKVVSKAVSAKNEELGKYIADVGNSVVDASKGALDSVSQFADGAVRGAYGVVKKDDYHKGRGWNDIKDSSSRTVKGIGTGIKYTAKSAGITLQGLKNKDKDQILHGVKNLGKVAAVTTFAVGVIDIIDGSDTVTAQEIDTRNSHLNGLEHAETGVSFEQRTIELPNGDLQTGTFPVFESQFSVVLAEEMYLESDRTHFSIANETLYQSIQENPSLARELGLSSHDMGGLKMGVTPEGYVWHHHEQPGVIQLVDEEIHQNTGHTGGREIWGGGSNYR
ncbi:HNH endonuclease [Bacillus sp. DTU_2020_1000418_1_SI_GHA_SEK_038]|uniref:HNH endonuclease n=1 Tax=Bacillus sp. DTU_2020_1000418_1_SI_GHA_SEK_038 TaxID=3077585 RepID=UPI0028EDFA79|nr:HNH endonuclease [Bacillus sp. DTU_2020_1000418_1_SI_GHA_SEK_038]WNS76266.1 HNH endonuclease [Bacillus sp. DTU_2020_1000418_1_SI_GHA_SEK_038]